MAEQRITLTANNTVLAPTTNSEYVFMANGENLQYVIDNLPSGGGGNGVIDSISVVNDSVLSIGRNVTFNSSGLDSGLLAYGDNINFSNGGSSRLAIGQNIDFGSTITNNALAIGRNVSAGNNSIAIGYDTIINSSFSNSILIGMNASSNNNNTVVIGYGASSTNNSCVSIGVNSTSRGLYSITLGPGANSTSGNSIAIGRAAIAGFGTLGGLGAIALGNNTYAGGQDSIALGNNATILQYTYGNSAAIGPNATVTAASQFFLSDGYTSVSGPVDYTSRSDKRDKTDISEIDINKSYELITSINPVEYKLNPRFNYLDDSGDGLVAGARYNSIAHELGEHKRSRTRVGLIAQDVNEQIVNIYGNDDLAGDIVYNDQYDLSQEERNKLGESRLSLSYTSLIPHLVGTIQVLSKRVDELEKKINNN